MDSPSHFFAYMARMKFIQRWGVMRNTQSENIQEHSLQAAILAHALAVIARDQFGRDVDPERVMALAVFHDASEVITGDLPSPIKHHDPELSSAYGRIEEAARERLTAMLPDDMRDVYRPLLLCKDRPQHVQLVKAADKLCSYLKCLEELKGGNEEFTHARDAIEGEIEAIDLPEVAWFMERFVTSFSLTLDELNQ
ncbi:MAG: 5'-deoxynucleotidase [Candidatus Latescibacterota bacterium]|nr:5'-deoxynucleotidase [Candidatus Latescibacterota bacterium]